MDKRWVTTRATSYIRAIIKSHDSWNFAEGFPGMLNHGLLALATSLLSIPVASAIPWNATEYLFVFGDSYTTDGYNISAGINSPDPGYVCKLPLSLQ